MTGVRSNLRTARGVIALAAVLATSVLSCGGDDDTADDPTTTEQAEPTTTTVPSYDVERARAAVNAVTDLPDGYTISARCLEPADVQATGEQCLDDEADRVVFRAGNEAESQLGFQALVFDDAAAAAGRFAEWGDNRERYDGSFDIPAEDANDGIARRGEGTSEETEVGGWSGYRDQRDYDRIDEEGGVINHVTEVQVSLIRGNVLLQVFHGDVEAATSDAVTASVEDRVRRLVDAID